MAELMTALYKDKRICILDILDKNEQYLEDMRSLYRDFSQANELKCPECNQTLQMCAGSIVKPYFRHKELKECEYTRLMKTKAGIRQYFSRYMLAQWLNNQNISLVVNEGKSTLPYTPVTYSKNNIEYALIYLDSVTRNYEELRNNTEIYRQNSIVPIWFLNENNMSNSINITSDEAEIAMLNNENIYYINHETKMVTIRRKYNDIFGIAHYFTARYNIERLFIDAEGSFDTIFMKEYRAYLENIKNDYDNQKLKNLHICSIEDGIEEAYFNRDYVMVPVFSQIWILPDLIYNSDEDEVIIDLAKKQARKNRKSFVEEKIEFLSNIDSKLEQKLYSKNLIEMINIRTNADYWIV